MKTCPKCGLKTSNDKAKFCKHCGSPMPDAKPSSVQPIFEPIEDEAIHSAPAPKATVEPKQADPEPIPVPNPSGYNPYAREPLDSDNYDEATQLGRIDVSGPRIQPSFDSMPPTQVVPAKKKSKTGVIVVVTIITLVVILAVSLFFLNGNGANQAVSTADSVSVVAEPDQTAIDLLNETIRVVNRGLPREVENGFSMVELKLYDDYLVYNFSGTDAAVMDMESKKDTFRNENLVNAKSSNAEARNFYEVCVNAGRGIAFHFVGDHGAKCAIVITRDELKDALR